MHPTLIASPEVHRWADRTAAAAADEAADAAILFGTFVWSHQDLKRLPVLNNAR